MNTILRLVYLASLMIAIIIVHRFAMHMGTYQMADLIRLSPTFFIVALL